MKYQLHYLIFTNELSNILFLQYFQIIELSNISPKLQSRWIALHIWKDLRERPERDQRRT